MRRLSVAATVLAFCAFSVLGVFARPAAADSSPSVPTSLSMSVPGRTGSLPAGTWTSATSITLHFQVAVVTQSAAVTPQVEIEPLSAPFTGQPTNIGLPQQTSGPVTMTVHHLANGTRYHWQARTIDSTGLTSDWTTLSGSASSMDFGVDRTPPSRPVIQSPSNPLQSTWSHARVVILSWSATDTLSGIQGYTYVVEQRPHVIPPGSVSQQTQIRLPNLADGVWFLALRAVDKAGNWSPTATYRVMLDRQIPRISWLSPARFTFNPFRGPTSVRFSVSKASRVTLKLYRVGSNVPVQTFTFPHVQAQQTISLIWNGRNGHGEPDARGYYFFSAVAIDRAHNILRVNLGGISVQPEQAFRSPSGQLLYPDDGKRIIVSLSRQTLYAYDGTHLVVQTLVTTGNPNLPTPLGSYSIFGKYHPFQFVSPWPIGSPYWYAPSWVQYAMLFRQGGYFLHDAPWRSVFGPGSNGPGQPGTNYGGTHGCVNIPPSAMTELWNWAPMGTRVDIVP